MEFSFRNLGEHLSQIHAGVDASGIARKKLDLDDWEPPRAAREQKELTQLVVALAETLNLSATEVFNCIFQLCMVLTDSKKPKGIGTKSNQSGYSDPAFKILNNLKEEILKLDRVISNADYQFYPIEFQVESSNVLNAIMNLDLIAKEVAKGEEYRRQYRQSLDQLVEWTDLSHAKEIVWALHHDLSVSGVVSLVSPDLLWKRYLELTRLQKKKVESVSAVSTV